MEKKQNQKKLRINYPFINFVILVLIYLLIPWQEATLVWVLFVIGHGLYKIADAIEEKNI